MASASPPAVQSWHEPTSLWLVPKIEETIPWKTLQKHWGGEPSNQTHQQRRRPDRNTRLTQTLDRCDKVQWRLQWRPVNVFCKINSILKRKSTVCRTFEMTHVYSLKPQDSFRVFCAFGKVWLPLTIDTHWFNYKLSISSSPYTYPTEIILSPWTAHPFDGKNIYSNQMPITLNSRKAH